MPQFVHKNKPSLEASGSPKVEKQIVSKSWESQGCTHCDLCYGAQGPLQCCPSEGSSLTKTHSSTKAYVTDSPTGIQNGFH